VSGAFGHAFTVDATSGPGVISQGLAAGRTQQAVSQREAHGTKRRQDRRLDAPCAALVATAAPLRRGMFGRNSAPPTDLLSIVRASALVELAGGQVRPRHGSLQHALRALPPAVRVR
jgi:hypothetical protein